VIGFDLNNPGMTLPDGGATTTDAASAPPKGQYDAPAHGITGVAFDVDAPPSGSMRVEFQTLGTESNAAWWGGATSNASPLTSGGHYEIRWPAVGGPSYLTDPPLFDPTKLESVVFHVFGNASAAVPYSICVNNVTLLTN
jgi:hypothetical protein